MRAESPPAFAGAGSAAGRSCERMSRRRCGPRFTQTADAAAWHGAPVQPRADLVGMSDAGHDDDIERLSVQVVGGQRIGWGNRQSEELSGLPVVHHADQSEVGALQADVGNLGDVAGTVEHDPLAPVRVLRAALGDDVERQADLLARLRVKVNGVFERQTGGTAKRFPAVDGHQIPDLAPADTRHPDEALGDQPADQEVRQAKRNAKLVRQASLRDVLAGGYCLEDLAVVLVVSARQRTLRAARLDYSASSD